MKELHAEDVLVDGLVFPEGPRWRDGRLYLSDMGGGRVVSIDESGEMETIAEVPESPSGLGFLPDGRLLVVSMRDRKLLRQDPGGLRVHADLAALAPGWLNDMVVDDHGRAYVGNFGYDALGGEAPRPTRLVLVEPDGRARPVGDELVFPNGTVITEDRQRLVVAQTWGHALTCFDIEEDGSLTGCRPFAEHPGREFDGIALDVEDAVWTACFGQEEFVRVHEGGRISARVGVEGRHAVACALGGEDRRTLFLLTATEVEKMMEGAARGRVEILRVDVPGAGIP